MASNLSAGCELVFCGDGLRRHAAGLGPRLVELGHLVRQVECFERCETCESHLLCRVDGTMLAVSGAEGLLAALAAIEEAS